MFAITRCEWLTVRRASRRCATTALRYSFVYVMGRSSLWKHGWQISLGQKDMPTRRQQAPTLTTPVVTHAPTPDLNSAKPKRQTAPPISSFVLTIKPSTMRSLSAAPLAPAAQSRAGLHCKAVATRTRSCRASVVKTIAQCNSDETRRSSSRSSIAGALACSSCSAVASREQQQQQRSSSLRCRANPGAFMHCMQAKITCTHEPLHPPALPRAAVAC